MNIFRSIILIILVGSALIYFSGCSETEEIVGVVESASSVEQLLKVPKIINVQGRNIYFYTSLNRDFMPYCPPDGRPMTGVIYITANDDMELSGIECDTVWVIYEGQLWKSSLSKMDNSSGIFKKNQIGRYFSGGPKWGPNIYVNVVIRINDSYKNRYLLRASDQYVGRTD
jgi:hypothetical protein